MANASAVNPVQERRVPIPGPRRPINRLSPLTQALDLKTQAYSDALSEQTPVHIRAALMRAWVDLQEVVMALRGQGKPKPVEARNAQPKRKPRSAGPVGDAAPTRAREPLSSSKDIAPRAETPDPSSPAPGNAS